MSMLKKSYWLFIIMIFLSSACQPRPEAAKKQSKLVINKLTIIESKECKEPRLQMCTKQYSPVCATRDTGVRCITTPCPSTELVTKSNACMACADEKVFSFTPGACSSTSKP